jgi:hypothetical protein
MDAGAGGSDGGGDGETLYQRRRTLYEIVG